MNMSWSQITFVAAALIAVFAVVKASSDTVYSDHVYYHGDEGTTPPTSGTSRNCYQCSYTPPRTSYVEKEIEVKVHDLKNGGYKILREKKLMPENKVGGWDKCGGKFSYSDALRYEIAEWACEHKCFVRVDKAGNLFRGCYRGEFGVDPFNVNEIQQVGNSQYQFCDGPLCNNFEMFYQ